MKRHGGRRPDRGARAPESRATSYARILAALKRSREPLSVPALAGQLGLDDGSQDDLRAQMWFLERQGVVFSQRRGRWSLHSRGRFIIGRLSCPRPTYGFVRSEEAGSGDLFVSGRQLGTARHGDLVLARAVPAGRGGRTGDSRGAILAVLEARSPYVAGVYHSGADGGSAGQVEPRDVRTGGPIRVERAKPAPSDGDVVWVQVTAPGSRFEEPRGLLIDVLGSPEDPAVQRETVVRMYELPTSFPERAIEEARALRSEQLSLEGPRREDCRDDVVVTVDPRGAKDHDDAVGLEVIETGDGLVHRLSVHIADVSHFVRPGSALDSEAARRGTSVYFPGECIPMLPEAISADLCSLREGDDRLVQTVIMDFDAMGRRKSARFADAIIRSRARLTYEQVEQIITGREDAGDPVSRMLLEMEGLRRRLRERRLERGSLDLDLPETRVEVDSEGRPVDIRPEPHLIAHSLIEEFMLAANETVAGFLRESRVGGMFRIHEEAEAASIEEVEHSLRDMGFPVRRGRGAPGQRVLSLLASFSGRPEQQAVSMLVLRALKLARYSHRPGLHFGLAADPYTHFTSPIRRYPDLLVHRSLRAARAAARTRARRDEDHPGGKLEELARRCSDLERRAEGAERTMVDWKAAVFMARHVGEEFHGRITGLTDGAFFVTLEDYGVEGIVSRSNPSAHRGSGRSRRTGAPPGPRLGDPMRVRIQSVDTFRARILLKALSTG